MKDRENLLAEIARAEAALARLDQQRAVELRRVEELKQQAAALDPHLAYARDRSIQPEAFPAIPSSPVEKVALFRSLFRGREDIYPRFWQNARKGKKGYAPACDNEWVHGICDKPRIKCGACPNQAFTPVTDQAVQDHLQGRHVIGVYPLLPDETCWLLAVDFDKKSWAEDVTAFRQTCIENDLPTAIERSRSGNGAHAWFFFTAPVPATTARRMGCALLTETMSRRHQLGLASYDRLFPNQDTMPRGGFGNLIALPLQHEARKRGNTLFLDENLVPYPDPWAYLAAIQRIEPGTVEALAEEALRQGRVIGVRLGPTEEDEATPWDRPPSGRPRPLRITKPLPSEVRAVLAQRLFVEKDVLPSPLLNAIKRLAAFQNPEFYKRQSLRLSTAGTSRVIACAEEHPQHLALPRGCVDEVRDLLRAYKTKLAIEDKRQHGTATDFAFQGRLSPMQAEAVEAILAHDLGVFVAPPGTGKTVVGTYLVAARRVSTLVLVHRKPLMEQWVAQLALFLGLPAKSVGQIVGGRRRPNGVLDVAMIQSLDHRGEVDDLVAGYGQVIVDECHHLAAVSFERVLAQARARYVTGLTATPYRRDGHQPIIHMQCGPVRFAVRPDDQAARRPFAHRLVIRDTGFPAAGVAPDTAIQTVYSALAEDARRNDLIAHDVLAALDEGRCPIVLTERRDHLELLAQQLRDLVGHLIVLQGGMRSRQRRETLERLRAIPENSRRLILATGRYIGEGFDDARLDTLFLALPVSWKGTLVQYTGRLHRLHPGKTEVRIYDYTDREIPVLARMFQRRLKGYRAIGYTVEDALPFPRNDGNTGRG